MKKLRLPIVAMGILLFTISFCKLDIQAASEEQTIHTDVYIDDVDLSGMTAEQATAEVENIMNELKAKKFTLLINSNPVEAAASDFGLEWTNTELIEEAMKIGQSFNIVQKYKISKDLEQEPIVFNLEYEFNRDKVVEFVNNNCLAFDAEPVNGSLTRSNGEFQITGGSTGLTLDVEASVEAIYSYITNDWNKSDGSVELVTQIKEPEVTAEELAMVTDVLGSFTTNFSSSTSSRAKNLDTGAAKINGIVLYPGEQFSMYEVCAPFTIENGYGEGSAFENGKVVPSIGGGICQVSTTLYNAVILSELEVTERYNHSMQVTYVKPSMDAAISGTYMDFKFVNNTAYPIYIEGYTANRNITFNIYGHNANTSRSVSFVSEVTGTTAAGVKIEASNSSIGSIEKTQTPHEGGTARLWKVVTENGVEVSREQFNSSTYYASPTIYSVGISSSDASATAKVQAAIATGDIDQVRSVVNSILSAPVSTGPAETEAPETEAPATEEPITEAPIPEV